MEDEIKRLFFGFEVSAPWPAKLPVGRLLKESERHMTVEFLGRTNFTRIAAVLSEIPLLPLKVGLTGYFNRLYFLPEHHPRQVMACSARTITEEMPDAYKNVDKVVEACQEAGLANMVARLKPYLVLKG